MLVTILSISKHMLFFCCFFLPVLEVCGYNGGLLSELGAVGKFVFFTVQSQQPDFSLRDRRVYYSFIK